jgi:hypothetical protein
LPFEIGQCDGNLAGSHRFAPGLGRGEDWAKRKWLRCCGVRHQFQRWNARSGSFKGAARRSPDDARSQLAERVVRHLEQSGFEVDEEQKILRKRSPRPPHRTPAE